MNGLITPIPIIPSVIIPYFMQENFKTSKSKRGRKTACSTEILSDFLDKKKKKNPRKEYIRCCVLRKMIKLIRSVMKNMIKTALHPILIEILKLISANMDESRLMIKKSSLPYVENHENTEFKSYNDAFCKHFFSRPLAKEVYKLYVEYLFIARTEEQRNKDLGVFCCNKVYNDHDCSAKWEKLKKLLLQEVEEKKNYCVEENEKNMILVILKEKLILFMRIWFRGLSCVKKTATLGKRFLYYKIKTNVKFINSLCAFKEYNIVCRDYSFM